MSEKRIYIITPYGAAIGPYESEADATAVVFSREVVEYLSVDELDEMGYVKGWTLRND